MADTATAETTAHRMLNISIGKGRRELYEKLEALTADLKCSRADLVWFAIKNLTDEPPTEAPEGSKSHVGSAMGFWVVPTVDNDGKATAIAVQEVASRAQLKGGRTFFRYGMIEDESTGEASIDTKGRKRARNQAVKAAKYDCQLLGVDSFNVNSVIYNDELPEIEG